jgi:hypothetical protein
VQTYRRSGLSQKEFCRKANISYWSFNQWKRRLEQSDAEQQLTKVHVKHTLQSERSEERIIITVNRNISISLPVTISIQVITQILSHYGNFS